MTEEEYREAHNRILLEAYFLSQAVLKSQQRQSMTEAQWNRLMQVLFELVKRLRESSARLGRALFDAERERFIRRRAGIASSVTPLPIRVGRRPGIPVGGGRVIPFPTRPDRPRAGELPASTDRHDFYLPDYEYEWFKEAMDQVKVEFIQSNTPDSAVDKGSRIIDKQVAGGSRRASLRGVRGDGRAIGWARIEGGGESCAMCAMLISRGPIYKSAASANFRRRDGKFSASKPGLGADEEMAMSIWRRFERTGNEDELSGLMNKWHENCDCLVVPVFDKSNFMGRDSYLYYEKEWIAAQRAYKAETGKTSFRKEKYHAFRRYLDRKAAREGGLRVAA